MVAGVAVLFCVCLCFFLLLSNSFDFLFVVVISGDGFFGGENEGIGIVDERKGIFVSGSVDDDFLDDNFFFTGVFVGGSVDDDFLDDDFFFTGFLDIFPSSARKSAG